MNEEVLNKCRDEFEKNYDTGLTTWMGERNSYQDNEIQYKFKKFMDAFILGYDCGLEAGSIKSTS